MSMFSGLKAEGVAESEDRLGGYSVKETDIYLATVKMAYGIKSTGGAMGVSFVFNIDNKEYNETIYVSTKDGKMYYHPKDDKGNIDTSKKNELPGFTTVNDICMLTTEIPLTEQETEEKVVKIYDYEAKKEVPTAVNALTALIGKQVYLAIVKQTVDKTQKNDAGDYVPTGETREENTIEKAFHHEYKLTMVEARNNSEPTFFDAWREKNKGVTRDKSKGGKDGTKTGKPGGPPQAGSNQGQTRTTGSLFGGNK